MGTVSTRIMLAMALLLAMLAALCLGLSGCENEDACIRQALIDMGYMSPTPETGDSPEASVTPEASETPEPGETPDVSILPEPVRRPTSAICPHSAKSRRHAAHAESAHPECTYPRCTNKGRMGKDGRKPLTDSEKCFMLFTAKLNRCVSPFTGIKGIRCKSEANPSLQQGAMCCYVIGPYA